MNFETDFLNIKDSTRNLSDEEFEMLLPRMAEQLEQIDYHYNHSEQTLYKSWDKLKNYQNQNHYTASQVRTGLELCEFFFPNFFDIKNKQGKGFSFYWKKEYLEKILTWNRKSHSTPYLSELRRGIYFCYGLPKSTMYRPHLAKMICDYYNPKIVLDCCCGWGGRLLGTVASGAHYIGFEPNTETYSNLLNLVNFLNIEDKVSLYNEGAENIDDSINADLMLTSPPYFNTEVYCDEPTQSITNFNNYQEWLNEWLTPLIIKMNKICDTVCWNVAPNMREDVEKVVCSNGFKYDSDFGLSSSARQANQNLAKNKKTKDSTICYKKQERKNEN